MPILVLLATAVMLAGDLVMDRADGSPPGHLLLEAISLVASLAAAAVLLAGWRAERLRARQARLEADAALLAQQDAAERARHWQAEADRWREEAQDSLRGLGQAIDQQFERWALTPAEREVALLLLKGLSMKETAAVREVSERTVREQARHVYSKAGLGGRAELSAFFLEDLLLPRS